MAKSTSWRRYWSAYGGFAALFTSAYFYAAIICALVSHEYWRSRPWWADAIAILPNILGFALGGYAVLLGFGDEKFRRAISGSTSTSKRSPYLVANAAFVHFMLVLATALLGAVAFSYRPLWLIRIMVSNLPLELVTGIGLVMRGMGVTAFIYALILILPVTINLYRLAETYDASRTKERSMKRSKLMTSSGISKSSGGP